MEYFPQLIMIIAVSLEQLSETLQVTSTGLTFIGQLGAKNVCDSVNTAEFP